jgi:hypothetical protein
MAHKVIHLPYAACVVHPVLEVCLHGRLELHLLRRIQLAVKLYGERAVKRKVRENTKGGV